MSQDGSIGPKSPDVEAHVVYAPTVISANRREGRCCEGRFDPQRYDPWYFTHTVRYEICQALDAIPPGVRDFEREQLPLSAIEVIYGEFRMKVWKSNDGELPIPGHSPGRSAFLRQPFLEQYLEALGDNDPLPLRLVFSWDVDAGLRLERPQLICPKDFDSPWKPANDHFSIPIPHPATSIASPSRFTQEPTELEIELELKKAGSGDDEPQD